MVAKLFRVCAGAAIVITGACSFALDFDDVQCAADADCADLASQNNEFVGTTCQQGLCVGDTGAGGQGGGVTGGCISSEQCTADLTGQPAICPAPGEACVPLLNEDCVNVLGDHEDPNAIFVGFMYPYKGSFVNQTIGETNECVVELARSQIQTEIGGLPNPNGGPPRPLVVVACDESTDPERARAPSRRRRRRQRDHRWSVRAIRH